MKFVGIGGIKALCPLCERKISTFKLAGDEWENFCLGKCDVWKNEKKKIWWWRGGTLSFEEFDRFLKLRAFQ